MDEPDLHLPNLLPGEEIVNIQHFDPPKKIRTPSSMEELEELAGTSKGSLIGAFGPVVASHSLPEHQARAFKQYETLFGRDSLRVALDLLDKFPRLARSTILVLAQLQGVMTNDASEEEPGRIVHEVRDPTTDPIAQDFMRERGWQWPYYGSVDATPEFVRLLTAYCERTREGAAILDAEYVGRDNLTHTVARALKQAVKWITVRLDENHEGLLEFHRRNPHGIENQVWKDSWDAYFHADGKIANHERGIASVEVQRVAYDALLDAAEVYERYLGLMQEAGELRERAARLRRVIMERFWTDDKGGYFIIGADRDNKGQLRPLKVRTSNMGHLLHSRLLMGRDPVVTERRESVIKQLFSSDFLCLNGIRTLASDEARFRPGAYHNGSCWGWDNYMIAQGLDLQGYHGLADYLKQIILDDILSAGRYVEFMRGDDDVTYRVNSNIVDVWDMTNQRLNRLEQPPQDMQAWTVAAVLAINLERQKDSKVTALSGHNHQLEQELLQGLPERPRHQRLPRAVHVKLA